MNAEKFSLHAYLAELTDARFERAVALREETELRAWVLRCQERRTVERTTPDRRILNLKAES